MQAKRTVYWWSFYANTNQILTGSTPISQIHYYLNQ
jgi:hypothetical protein